MKRDKGLEGGPEGVAKLGDRSPRGRKVIPLTPVEDVPPKAHGDAMRDAVLQVMSDLVIERVPEGERSPHFNQARALLEEAGWGPDELLEATDPGPKREALWQALDLGEG